MDVQVDEVNGDMTLLNLDNVRKEIARMIMAQLAEEEHLQRRRDSESKLRRSASNRPDDVA